MSAALSSASTIALLAVVAMLAFLLAEHVWRNRRRGPPANE
ncbi:hypothetical protein [Actinacidiphila soli]|nr:hypothetical protein [Actinacidiphila soli]